MKEATDVNEEANNLYELVSIDSKATTELRKRKNTMRGLRDGVGDIEEETGMASICLYEGSRVV